MRGSLIKLSGRRRPPTAVKALNVMSGMFRQAVRWKYMHHNPAADVERPRRELPEIDCLSEKEAAEILEAAEGRDKAILSVALGCGMRQGEILALAWGDVDWIRGRIRVTKSLEPKRKVSSATVDEARRILNTHTSTEIAEKLGLRSADIGRIKSGKQPMTEKMTVGLVKAFDGEVEMIAVLKEPKGRQKRTVYMPSWVKENLSELFQERSRPGPSEIVFVNSRGGYLNGVNWTKRNLSAILERAEVRNVTCHSLRHTYASLLLSKGVDPLFVSRQLGHSTIKITADYYGHLMNEDTAYGEVLDGLFPEAPPQERHKRIERLKTDT
ncbi:MAG: site-specific integrase [Actinomycetota bacterium]|nr:site-specific integrase [Actinomycetota bacterium]